MKARETAPGPVRSDPLLCNLYIVPTWHLQQRQEYALLCCRDGRLPVDIRKASYALEQGRGTFLCAQLPPEPAALRSTILLPLALPSHSVFKGRIHV